MQKLKEKPKKEEVRKIAVLVAKLNQYRHEYYNKAKPSVKDAVYDHLFDELQKLEKRTGIMSSVEQAEHLLGFFVAEEAKKDYSVIGSFSPAGAVGKCVYCNHCKPCPVGLDVGIINKYFDLARNGDSMAAQHYRNLEIKADACVQCGHCEARCPFHVKQEKRMKEIAAYFR